MFCSHCGHVATSYRKGALARSCAEGKREVIPKGSEFRRDQLLQGSLAGTGLEEWPDGASKETRKPVVRVTAAWIAGLGAEGLSSEGAAAAGSTVSSAPRRSQVAKPAKKRRARSARAGDKRAWPYSGTPGADDGETAAEAMRGQPVRGLALQGSGSPPETSQPAAAASVAGDWNWKALDDLVDLHRTGAQIVWPHGYDLEIAKEAVAAWRRCQGT